MPATDEEHERFGNLGGEYLDVVDTPIEFALLSYYSPVVRNIRPDEASAMLPANNPKLAGLKLGAALLQEINVLRFLSAGGSSSLTAQIGRYEGMLKFICDKNGVTRTEIENFYRQGMRGLVAEIVNEEFNKMSFSLTNLSLDRTYNSVLTRNPQNRHYTLSYKRPSIQNSEKECSAPTLEALLSEMRNGKNKTDFTSADMETVREQAKLIPAVVYADWKAKGLADGVDAMALIIETLTNFYLAPSAQTYEAVVGIYARYLFAWELTPDKERAAVEAKTDSLLSALHSLSNGLSERMTGSRIDIRAASRIPDDPRFNVFAARYTGR